MRRLLAIVLLVLLPLQFSWAAVASYCKHETQADAEHFGHHEHQHHGNTTVDADPAVDPQAEGDKTLGAMDVDCGHCHGHCSVMLTLSGGLPGLKRKIVSSENRLRGLGLRGAGKAIVLVFGHDITQHGRRDDRANAKSDP